MGANEVVEGVTGTNYIKDATGMSDETYSTLYTGLNIASAVGTVAGRMGMRAAATVTKSTHGTTPRDGQRPYTKIIDTKENKTTYFDGRGDAIWSRHDRLHSGKIGNLHWHSEIGGHGPEQSYVGMLLRLIGKSIFGGKK